jgi:hypothetical protein
MRNGIKAVCAISRNALDRADRNIRCAALVVAVGTLVAGCTDSRGGIDIPRTVLLGLGAGAATAGVGALIAKDQQHRPSYPKSRGYGGYGHSGYGYGSSYQPQYRPYYGDSGYGRGTSRGYGW